MNDKRAKALAAVLSKNWKLTKNSNPFVVLVGGFQGSGKTTLLEGLRRKLNLLIISRDAMRDKLLGQELDRDTVKEVVNQTTLLMTKKACQLSLSFAIDGNAKPDDIERVLQLIPGNYRLYTLLLKGSEQALIWRVLTRPKWQGFYQGTLEELLSALQTYSIDEKSYGLVIDTTEKSKLKVLEEVLEYLGSQGAIS